MEFVLKLMVVLGFGIQAFFGILSPNLGALKCLTILRLIDGIISYALAAFDLRMIVFSLRILHFDFIANFVKNCYFFDSLLTYFYFMIELCFIFVV